MLRLNTSTGTFEQVEETALKEKKLLERYDLQKAIVSSWEVFKNEIGIPSAYLIGQEINPDPCTQDAMDLLAYDPDDSSLIVIELKRDRNKLQLLQALGYAAMVSRWDSETLLSKVHRELNPEFEDLEAVLSNTPVSPDVHILLVAESFDPEVIITAHWLSSNYSVDITAFAVELHQIEGQIFVTVDQRYPLRELDEAYEKRGRNREVKTVQDSIDWDDVIPKLTYSFGERGIKLCQRIRDGDPLRRRFGNIRKSYDGFDWITLNFRRNHLNLYLRGKFDGDKEFLQSKFRTPVEITSWRDGYSINISSEDQFNDVIKWLRLEN